MGLRKGPRWQVCLHSGRLCSGKPLFALFAALGAGSVVVLIAVVGRRLSPASIALTGLAIAASLSALSTLVVIEAKLQVAEALSGLRDRPMRAVGGMLKRFRPADPAAADIGACKAA